MGDADRNECVEVLTEARALGTLSADEFEERVDHAWRSRVRADLDVLTVDMPVSVGTRGRAPRGARWVPTASTARRRALNWGVPVSGVTVLVWFIGATGGSDEAVFGGLLGGVTGVVVTRIATWATRER